MYEVTFTLEGVLHTVTIPANDSAQINEIITNMYGTSDYRIINFIRKG